MARQTSNGNNTASKMASNIGDGNRFHCAFPGCAFGNQKSFKKEIFLKQHVLNCHSERTYHCPTCCKSFAIDWQLKYHQRTCGQDWVCVTCNRLYKERLSLITHCKRHSHELPSGAILRKPRKSDGKSSTNNNTQASMSLMVSTEHFERPKKKGGKGSKAKQSSAKSLHQQQQQQLQQSLQHHQQVSAPQPPQAQAVQGQQLPQQLQQIELQAAAAAAQQPQLHQLQQLQAPISQQLLQPQCHIVNGQCTIQVPAHMLYSANSNASGGFVMANLPSNMIQIAKGNSAHTQIPSKCL